MTARQVSLWLLVAVAGAAAGYGYARFSSEADFRSAINATSAGQGASGGQAEGSAFARSLGAQQLAQADSFVVGSLAEAIAQPTDFTQTVATYVLAARSDAAGLRQLIIEADGMSHQGDRSAVLAILFSRYGDIDPHAALAFLDATGLSPKTNLLFTIFNSWAKRDPDSAIAGAHERTDSRDKMIASDAILRAYEESGSDTLASIRGRLPGGDDGPQNLNEILRLVTIDPEAAISRVLRVSGVPTEQLLAEVAGRWASQDPEAAYDYSARIQDPTLRDWYKRGVFYRWTERDPDRVIAILNEGLSRADETIIVNAAMRVLAAADPQDAFARVAGMRDAAVRSTAYRILMRTWAPDDPDAAAQAVFQMEDESVRQELAGLVAASMVQQSPEAALAWARELDGGNGPTWSQALLAIAETNPQYAINHVFAVAAPSERNQSLLVLFTGLAQSSPESAASYWRQIPDTDMQSVVAMQIAGEWGRRDPVAAERWVLELPAGPVRDNSLARLITGGSYAMPETARLVNAIADEGRRAETLRVPLIQLARSEGVPAAEALLSQVVLSAEWRRDLVQMVRNQDPGK